MTSRTLLRGLLAAFALLILPTSAIAPAQQTTPTYAAQVTRGEGGSHILGNPAAPVRLVEYVSYTCPHCKDFVEESATGLRRYIASGQVSLEVRHLVLSAPDIGMTVAAQCGAPARFFSRHDSLMALQPSVLQRASTITPARADAIRALPPLPRIRALATDSGVIGWMRGRGFTSAQIDRCFADQSIIDRIEAMRSAALAAGVTGTPSFAINGTLVSEAHSWAALQPQVDAALAAIR